MQDEAASDATKVEAPSSSPKRLRPNPAFLTGVVSGMKKTNQRLTADAVSNAACKVPLPSLWQLNHPAWHACTVWALWALLCAIDYAPHDQGPTLPSSGGTRKEMVRLRLHPPALADSLD